MSKFVDRIAGRTSQEREAVVDETARESNLAGPQAESPAVSRLAHYTAQEAGQDDRPHDAVRPTPKEDEAVELVTDYGKLGEHVTSVLEAANAAAAKIRNEARAGAERLAERTRNEATALLEKARQEADKVSLEAEHLRAETKKEVRETRERANDYAAEKRRDAEGEAAAIVARAKREASEHTKAAQERGSALANNVALSEERLRQLVGGLRDLAGRLEELVQAETSRGDSPNVLPDEASLEESLRPSEAAAKRSPQPRT